MSRVSRRWYVSGRVQGVGFRATCRGEASRLALNGLARNLSDARVEVAVEGEPGAVDLFEAWLRAGPAGARVDALEPLAPLADLAPGFHVQ